MMAQGYIPETAKSQPYSQGGIRELGSLDAAVILGFLAVRQP
jgi:hypothetical protein